LELDVLGGGESWTNNFVGLGVYPSGLELWFTVVVVSSCM